MGIDATITAWRVLSSLAERWPLFIVFGLLAAFRYFEQRRAFREGLHLGVLSGHCQGVRAAAQFFAEKLGGEEQAQLKTFLSKVEQIEAEIDAEIIKAVP